MPDEPFKDHILFFEIKKFTLSNKYAIKSIKLFFNKLTSGIIFWIFIYDMLSNIWCSMADRNILLIFVTVHAILMTDYKPNKYCTTPARRQRQGLLRFSQNIFSLMRKPPLMIYRFCPLFFHLEFVYNVPEGLYVGRNINIKNELPRRGKTNIQLIVMLLRSII